MSTRPLNVLWLIDHVCYDGSLHGGGRLFMNLVPRFDSSRVRVFPYFLRASEEVQRLFAAARHPVINLDKGKYDPTTFATLANLCRNHEIDVMHLFCYASSTFGRLVGVAKGIPTVIHDFDTQVYFPYPLYLKLLDRLLGANTARALAASAFCRDYMRDVRKVPADRIEVLYHAIPTSQLQACREVDRDAARGQLGLRDEFTFAAITKLGPERGNENLLEAFAVARKSVLNARLFIVYKPTLYHRMPEEYSHLSWARDPKEMRPRLERIIEELKLGTAVTLAESLERPERYYAASDVLVAPFENVRFSSVNLIEGMAYGRPHIVTDVGEPRELVDRYGAGVKVKVGDVEALARAMIEIGSSRAHLETLSRRAHAAAADLTVDAAAERLTRLYQSLHAARRSQPERAGAMP